MIDVLLQPMISRPLISIATTDLRKWRSPESPEPALLAGEDLEAKPRPDKIPPSLTRSIAAFAQIQRCTFPSMYSSSLSSSPLAEYVRHVPMRWLSIRSGL